MKQFFRGRFRYLIALWLAGTIALALATWVCFRLGLNSATTAFVYMIVIVLLSLMDSFISSAVFSLVAVGCLNFFFVQPLYTFQVASAQDVTTLVAFIITSLAVTSLVRRVSRLGEVHGEQKLLLDLTRDSVFVRDPDDVITYWNRGAEELYGWKKEEALGKVPHALLQTIFPAPLAEITATLHRTNRWEGELVHTRRDGKQVNVASRWSLQRDGDGQPIGTLETNNDITDRRRADDELRRTQETYLAEAQQLSHTGSFGWSIASGEIFWSKESFRIFGYDTSMRPTIERVMQRVHPDDRDLVQRVIDRAVSRRQDFDFEHRLLMPDGAVKHLHVVAHVAREQPDKLQFMGAIMDITARRKAEEALRQSEQRYRHLFHYMPIALWQLDARGLLALFRDLRAEGVTDLSAYLDRHPDFLRRAMDAFVVDEVNERAVVMLGARDAGELSGSVARWWRESPDTFRRALEARFRGDPTFEEETRILTLDGRIINVLFTAARPGSFGDLGISLVGLIDITARIRAQERLERVQAEFAHAARISMLGELTASIAHELNQPLAAVKTSGEAALRWLDRSEPSVTKARELMRRIIDDAGRAADIVARTRAMAVRRATQATTLSLHGVIEESMIFLRHELQSKGIALSLDLAPALPRVTGDRTQLQQVVVNLAINAVQAMAQSDAPRRALLIETALSEAGTVRCIFQDSGPGIDPQHLDHLFDSFFTTKNAGMGMGLSISRSIIEAHAGRIRADNESVLGGARFSFELPATDEASGQVALP
jgi:PAS domain S-box-containing protein